ncbi:MAG: hemerythrin domain-containing protein [Nocardioides sp.]
MSADDRTRLADLRRRRAELRESLNALERALSAPAPAGLAGHWAERVHAALLELAGDFREHLAVTEGPDGLYQDLARRAPRLAGQVSRLVQDHVAIGERLEGLLSLMGLPVDGDEVRRIRELGTELLGSIVRHRQHGADLVYEAYEVDIGGDE